MCAKTKPTSSNPVTATANLAPTLEFSVTRSQREKGGFAAADGSAVLVDILGSLRAQVTSTGIPSRIAARDKTGHFGPPIAIARLVSPDIRHVCGSSPREW